MPIRLRALLSLLLLLPALTVAATARNDVVLVVGDSISAAYGMPTEKGWVNLLQKRVAGKGYPHSVVNASVSGDTSAGGLGRLPALLRQHRPGVVIVELGGNDGLRGLALKATRQNITTMVRLAQKSGAKVLLLGIDIPPNYGAAYTRDFASLYPGVAKATGARLLPSFVAGVATDPDMMQSDGIHPNSLAQPALAASVWQQLEPLLKASP